MADKIIDQINSTNQLIATDISDELTLVNPNVSPIMSYVYRAGHVEPATGVQYQWVDHKSRKTSSTLKAALATGATTLEPEDESILVKDALIAVGDEIVKITAVNTSAGTATIERGYAGTEVTASTVDAGAMIQSLGIEIEEGGDIKPSTTTTPVTIDNQVGIIFESYEVTDTAMTVKPYGQGSLSAQELESQKKKGELMGVLENRTLSGVKYTAGKARGAAGIKALIKKHGIVFDAKGKPLSLELIDEVAQEVNNSGDLGAADLKSGRYKLCANYTNQRVINNFNKDSLRTGIKDDVAGIQVTEVVTAGGVAKVFPASSLGDNEALFMNLDNLIIKQLSPIREEKAGRMGISNKYFMSGEQGPMLKNLPSQVLIINIGKATPLAAVPTAAPGKNGK